MTLIIAIHVWHDGRAFPRQGPVVWSQSAAVRSTLEVLVPRDVLKYKGGQVVARLCIVYMHRMQANTLKNNDAL